MIHKLCRPESLLFVALWIAFMVQGRADYLKDPGTLWHIRVGEQMLESGRPPQTDPFSLIHRGEPWRPMGWGSELVLGLLHRLGGFDAILIVSAACLAGLFTALARRLIRAGFHWSLALPLMVFLQLGTAFHTLARPHLATWLFLAWVYCRLLDFDAGRISLRGLFWLVPAFALWMNLHGGALAGIATLGIVSAGWGIAALVRLPAPAPSLTEFGKLAALGVACVLALLLNPYGWEHFFAALELSRSSVVGQVIAEHQPLPFGSVLPWEWPPQTRHVLTIAAFYLGVLAWAGWQRQFRLSWLVPLLWLALGLQRIRHAPLFSITALFAIVDMLPALAAPLAEKSWLYRPAGAPPPSPGWLALPAAILLAALAWSSTGNGTQWAKLDPDHWPMDLIPQLQAYEAAHPNQPVFNDMGMGGFLIYYTPRLPVFIDDRCELYGNEFILEYAQAYWNKPARLEEWARRYDLELALVTKNSSFYAYLEQSPDWDKLGEAGLAALYRRKAKKN